MAGTLKRRRASGSGRGGRQRELRRFAVHAGWRRFVYYLLPLGDFVTVLFPIGLWLYRKWRDALVTEKMEPNIPATARP